MRVSRFHMATLKETPADAEIASHRLMLRAGMIRRLAAGLYTWLPLGWRVLRKAEAIVRQEMDRAGALEVLMPAVQPAELWQESGRWDEYGPELLRLVDRHDRAFCFGPTHEEVITDLVRREVQSYRQLPLNLYQIQTKFRDEIRPRFGVMRAREFLMKDAYSFHLDEASLDESYNAMHHAYARIFERMGLRFRAVEAPTGAIGGNLSHEFHVLAESGEDAIAYCEADGYAANVELAPAAPPGHRRPDATETMTAVDTPDTHTIEGVSALLNVAPERCLKTLMVKGHDGGLVALLLRGDHELNTLKAERLTGVARPLTFADAEAVRAATGCGLGSLGPVGLDVTLYADHAALAVADFVCGANRDGVHLKGVNWDRDVTPPTAADLRNVVAGDPSPAGGGALAIARGIEVGHVFKLGTKYSQAMEATALDEQGNAVPLIMGCYGIGVSRVVAAAIEQNHDTNGIIWPEPLAPFQVALLPMNMYKSEAVREAAETLYEELTATGFEVLFDDRPVRAGVMFADTDLIGIPHRVVVGERGLAAGTVEYKARAADASEQVTRANLTAFLRERAGGL